MFNPHTDASLGAIAPTDTTGAAAAGAVAVPAPAPLVDPTTITIKITPPLNNLRLADVLDAITKVADQPIRFTIEDYAVVFSPKPAEAVSLYTKVFKVDPNTFIQGLQNVSAIELNPGTQSAGIGGAGGGGSSGGGGTSGGTTSHGLANPQRANFSGHAGRTGWAGHSGGQHPKPDRPGLCDQNQQHRRGG